MFKTSKRPFCISEQTYVIPNLKEDINLQRKCFTSADKISNIYCLTNEEHKKIKQN